MWHIMDNAAGRIIASGDTLLQALDMCPVEVFKRDATHIWYPATGDVGYSILFGDAAKFNNSVTPVTVFDKYRVTIEHVRKGANKTDTIEIPAIGPDMARFVADAVIRCSHSILPSYRITDVTQVRTGATQPVSIFTAT
jgi:hypothetical protein